MAMVTVKTQAEENGGIEEQDEKNNDLFDDFEVVVDAPDSSDRDLLEIIPAVPSDGSKKENASIDSKIDEVFNQLVLDAHQPRSSPVQIIHDLAIIEEPKIPRERAGDIEALKLLGGSLVVNNSILECAMSIILLEFIELMKRKPDVQPSDVEDLTELYKHVRDHDKIAALQQYEVFVTRLLDRGGDPDLNAILYLIHEMYFKDIIAF